MLRVRFDADGLGGGGERPGISGIDGCADFGGRGDDGGGAVARKATPLSLDPGSAAAATLWC